MISQNLKDVAKILVFNKHDKPGKPCHQLNFHWYVGQQKFYSQFKYNEIDTQELGFPYIKWWTWYIVYTTSLYSVNMSSIISVLHWSKITPPNVHVVWCLYIVHIPSYQTHTVFIYLF